MPTLKAVQAWIGELRATRIAFKFHEEILLNGQVWKDAWLWRMRTDRFSDPDCSKRVSMLLCDAANPTGAAFTEARARQAALLIVELAGPKEIDRVKGRPIRWDLVAFPPRKQGGPNPLIALATSAAEVLARISDPSPVTGATNPGAAVRSVVRSDLVTRIEQEIGEEFGQEEPTVVGLSGLLDELADEFDLPLREHRRWLLRKVSYWATYLRPTGKTIVETDRDGLQSITRTGPDLTSVMFKDDRLGNDLVGLRLLTLEVLIGKPQTAIQGTFRAMATRLRAAASESPTGSSPLIELPTGAVECMLLAAMTSSPLTGEQLAKKARVNFNSHAKSALAGLVKQRFCFNKRGKAGGYFLAPKSGVKVRTGQD